MEFQVKNLKSDLLGVENSNDKLRVLRLSATYDWLDDWNGITLVGLTISRGLDVLDATPADALLKSRATGLSQFTHTNFRINRVQDLPGPFDLVLSADGQYSADPLLSSEQCGYGGALYGRGFDSFEFAGDHCAKASIEMRWNLSAPEGRSQNVSLYGFYDAGKVWKKGEVLPGEYREEEATSAGIGMRAKLNSRVMATVEFAKPLEEEVTLEGNDDGRVFVTLGARF